MKTLKISLTALFVLVGMMLLSAEATTGYGVLLHWVVFVMYAIFLATLHHYGMFKIQKYSTSDIDPKLCIYLHNRGALAEFMRNINNQPDTTPTLKGFDWASTPEGYEYWEIINDCYEK